MLQIPLALLPARRRDNIVHRRLDHDKWASESSCGLYVQAGESALIAIRHQMQLSLQRRVQARRHAPDSVRWAPQCPMLRLAWLSGELWIVEEGHGAPWARRPRRVVLGPTSTGVGALSTQRLKRGSMNTARGWRLPLLINEPARHLTLIHVCINFHDEAESGHKRGTRRLLAELWVPVVLVVAEEDGEGGVGVLVPGAVAGTGDMSALVPVPTPAPAPNAHCLSQTTGRTEYVVA